MTDTYAWVNPYGGSWTSASNWFDTTAGTIASTAPAFLNNTVVTGTSNGSFTAIIGTGAAGQLTISNDVLLSGTVTVGGAVTLGVSADLDLDNSANLAAASLLLANSASLEVGDASTLGVTGVATITAGFLVARDAGAILLGGLIANSVNEGYALATSTIAVDANSSIEIGTAADATAGAVTIDSGATVAVSGTIDGNLIVNGALGIQALGSLAIDTADPFGTGPAISGTGTLTLSENSQLSLGVADAAAIFFSGPNGTLAVNVLPTGTITGFAAGDIIELLGTGSAQATGLRFSQISASVATLSFLDGGMPKGTLTLAGNYSGDLFHLALDTGGDASITLQTIGIAPVQPSLIVGTVGSDVLTATANNQTLTGLGGGDTLGAAAFTAIDFKDTSGDLTGATISSFGATDVIDLTNINLNTATVTFVPGAAVPGTLVVTDGTRSATIGLALAAGLPPGYFSTGTDGGAGTDVRYTAPNNDALVLKTGKIGQLNKVAKWLDTTTGITSTAPPSFGNAVTVNGASGFAEVRQNGFVASFTTSGDVLLWGTLVVGSVLTGVSGALMQTGTLALDAAAALVLDGTASVGGLIEIGGGATFTAAGDFFTGSSGGLLAIDASSARLPVPLGSSGISGGTLYASSVIGIDITSSVEFGSAGGAVAGALTIDTGLTVDLAGAINANVVVNGTLIAAGTLDITPFGSIPPSVSGAGTLELTYGATLGIAGPDAAAILFSPTAAGSYSTNSETLALGTIMPTATITGFVAGDVITVAMAVTNVTWNGTRLTLLNGATTVGSLLLAGAHAANQFQVQPIGNGLSSAITYASAPSITVGNAVSGTADAYTWNNTAGGVWSNPSQWTDTTLGTPATTAPGAGNAVTINDNTAAWTPQIIDGPAAAASLTITANAETILIGSFSITGLFSVASYGAASNDVALYGGSSLSASSLSVTSLLRVTSASLMTILGSSGNTFVSGDLAVLSDSEVRVQGGTSVISGTVAVDHTSSVEFGTANTAATGTLAIDYGQLVTLQGVATIQANTVITGKLIVYSATIEGFAGSAGSVSGTGTIKIGALGASGYLVLYGPDTTAIGFIPYIANNVPYAFESLEIKGALPTGLISGLIAGDSIIIDNNVTGATYFQTTATQGTLTLTNGAVTVGTLILAGTYAGQFFQTDVNAQTGVATISLQTAASPSGASSASSGSDAYSWTGLSGAVWNTAVNWQDTTTGTVPTLVPGSGTAVTIAGNPALGQYTTIGGNATSAGMTITGNVLFTGQNAVYGVLQLSGATAPPGSLTMQGAASIGILGTANIFGRFEVGGGSYATIDAYAVLSGGSLLALNGSVIQAAGLIGDGSGNVIAVDSSSVIRIGAAPASAPGTLTLATEAPEEFAGLICANVVDNAALSVSAGGTLLIDMTAMAKFDPYQNSPTISGGGLLLLAENSTLGLGVADSVAIDFNGSGGTLLLAAMPTAAICGFASGDQIDVEQTVTGLTYTQVNATFATVTLTNGAAAVGVLAFNGMNIGSSFAFHLDAAANGANAVITLQTLAITASPVALLYGTVGSDTLTATASGQTIGGLGGNDILNGGGFHSDNFRDLTANLNGSQIENFQTTDAIDFTDLNPGSASLTYTGGILSITDGTHSASISVSFATTPASGSFHIGFDGTAGTLLLWS